MIPVRNRDENSIAPTRPRSKWRRVLIAAALVLLACALTIVYFGFRAQREISRRLAEIQARGEPTTAAEMEAYYATPPKDEDATRLWLSAANILKTPAFEADAADMPIVGIGDYPPLPGEPWPEHEEVAAFLVKYSEALDSAHRAADHGGNVRFPINFEDGFNALLPHIQEARTTARMLILAAYSHAHQGDAAEAARSLNTCFIFGRSLRREPILVSYLVGIAIQGTSREALGRLLPTTDFSDDQLQGFQDELRKSVASSESSVRRALVGERWFGIEMFRDPGAMSGRPAGVIPGWRMTRVNDFTLYLDSMQQIIDATDLLPDDFSDVCTSVENTVTAKLNGSTLNRFLYIMTAMSIPALTAISQAHARDVAGSLALDAAIAAELYRREHGELPEKLSQLAPEFLPAVPTDPYDGQPLRYVAGDDGFVVYSVGPDRTDEGGNVEPEDGEMFTDVGVVIGYPATEP